MVVEGSGTQTADPVRAIASSTNATPIAVTTSVAHGYSTGDRVSITGHLVNTAANGVWTITVTSTTAFTLTGSVGNGVGAATGTVGRHLTVLSPSAAGTYLAEFDTANLVNGEVIEFRVRKKTLTGGTVRDYFVVSYAHAQSSPVKQSSPIVAPFGVSVTLAQPIGTARAFDWSVMSL